MTLNEYQRAALRTSEPSTDGEAGEKQLCVFALGIAGEAGEVADLVKKHIGHGHELSDEKLMKELGDVLWYVAAVAAQRGLSLEDVAAANIEKLLKRYPNGFSHEASRNRVELT